MPKNPGQFNPGDQVFIEGVLNLIKTGTSTSLISLLNNINLYIEIWQVRDMYNSVDWDLVTQTYPGINQGTFVSIINLFISIRAVVSQPFNQANTQVTALDLVSGCAGILLNIG